MGSQRFSWASKQLRSVNDGLREFLLLQRPSVRPVGRGRGNSFLEECDFE